MSNKKGFTSKVSIQKIGLFLFFWLSTGFTLGTLTLLFLIRQIMNYAQTHSWGEISQNILVNTVIVIFAICSFLLALFLSKVYSRWQSKVTKAAHVSLFLILPLITVLAWFNPDFINKGYKNQIQSIRSEGAEFNFGAYPTEQQLLQLKKEDYTAVISLLHAAVIPFEPKLIKEEKTNVQKSGIEFIHCPMLPWISSNEEALKKIAGIIQTGKGKYYVHCYLGKDRVNVVKNFILNNKGKISGQQQTPANRKLDEITHFERGKIAKLANDIYLTPFPTDEEFFGYFISGSLKCVVSLLSPKNPEDTMLINKEIKILSQYKVRYVNLPLTVAPYHPDSALKIKETIEKLPKPLAIHGYFSDKYSGEAIFLTFRTGKMAVPASLFQAPMKKGNCRVLSPNCVAGETPEKEEFKTYLQPKGIQSILCTAEKLSSAQIAAMKKAATSARLNWNYISINDSLKIKQLLKNGTWYLFGSEISVYQKLLIMSEN